MKKCLLALAALAVLSFPALAQCPGGVCFAPTYTEAAVPTDTAFFTLNLPTPEARLWLMGKEMKETGTARRYILNDPDGGEYLARVTWKTMSGEEKTRTWTFSVFPGKSYKYNLFDAEDLEVVDALDEVNHWRQTHGFLPFIRDHLLTIGADRCAKYRAANLNRGHPLDNRGRPIDSTFLPPGAVSASAGAGAWEPWVVTTNGETFGACNTDSRSHTYAGASYAYGRDGLRYMQIFVR